LHIFTSFSHFYGIGGSVPGSRLSFRILMGAWLLAAMVLVNSYSGTVVSYLTAPIMMPSINTLDDLAASEDVGILMVDNNVMGQQIMALRYLIK
jgi:ionotropic glutamate receptor